MLFFFMPHIILLKSSFYMPQAAGSSQHCGYHCTPNLLADNSKPATADFSAPMLYIIDYAISKGFKLLIS